MLKAAIRSRKEPLEGFSAGGGGTAFEDPVGAGFAVVLAGVVLLGNSGVGLGAGFGTGKLLSAAVEELGSSSFGTCAGGGLETF